PANTNPPNSAADSNTAPPARLPVSTMRTSTPYKTRPTQKSWVKSGGMASFGLEVFRVLSPALNGLSVRGNGTFDMILFWKFKTLGC
ncbi:MAG TPA: hypothetical protein VF758_00845, partial [Candidatus Acidoferrum sp.]